MLLIRAEVDGQYWDIEFEQSQIDKIVNCMNSKKSIVAFVRRNPQEILGHIAVYNLRERIFCPVQSAVQMQRCIEMHEFKTSDQSYEAWYEKSPVLCIYDLGNEKPAYNMVNSVIEIIKRRKIQRKRTILGYPLIITQSEYLARFSKLYNGAKPKSKEDLIPLVKEDILGKHGVISFGVFVIDFFKGLVQSVLKSGVDKYLEHNKNEEIFSPEEKMVLDLVLNHYKDYGKSIEFETLHAATGVEWNDQPDEPIAYWLDHKARSHSYKLLGSLSAGIKGDLENAIKTEEIIQTVKSSIIKCESVISTNLTLESMISADAFMSFMADHSSRQMISTPWPQLTEKIQGGLKQSELFVLAARPGVGKTMVLLQMLNKIWQSEERSGYNKKVLLVTTEMSTEAMQLRAMYFAGVFGSMGRLRRAMLSKFEQDWVTNLLRGFEADGSSDNFKVIGDSLELNIDLVEAQVEMFKPDVLAIDGVYLLKVAGKESHDKHTRIAEVFDRLKGLAKKKNISVIVTSQLNRSNNKGVKTQKIDLDRMAFSDNIGMVSDYIFFLTQDDTQRAQRQMCIEVGKLREGDNYSDVLVNWDFENFNFTEVPKQDLDKVLGPMTNHVKYSPPKSEGLSGMRSPDGD
jgi:replicative DNA helicase